MHALAVLAHQGGWDEALLYGIGIPAVLFAGWKLLDRIRGTPAEPHRWSREAGDGRDGAGHPDDGAADDDG